MKAKRLTALALAALMAASTTSVALAIRVDDDLVFADDGYYKYNSDTNRIESVDRRDDYQPGDDVYLRLDSSVSLPKEQTYNVYAEWTIGESWVKDTEIVYRKGDVIKTTTYDWKFTFDGTPYSGTGAAKNDDATKQSLIDSKLTEEVKNAYKSKYWDSVEGYEVKNLFYADAEKAAEAAGFEKQTIQSDQYTYNGQTGTLVELGLNAIPNSGFIYNNTYDSTTDAKAILKNLSLKDGDDVIYSVDQTTAVYVDNDESNDESNYGEVKDSSTGTEKSGVYVITVKGNDGINKKYWYTDDEGAKQVLLQKLGAKEASSADGYYLNNPLGQVVPASEVKKASGDTWVNVTRMSYPTAEDALKSQGISKTSYYVDKGKATTNGEVGVVDANAKLNEAVANAKNSFTWTEKTVTEPQYEYWVKITTKDSTTTKDIDVVGNIYVGEGTSKTSIKKGDKFSADFTLTNSEPTNTEYDEATDYVSIEPGTRAVVSFADDASDEFTVEFGDDAYFVFNARGQGKLNLAYNTKYDRDFAYDYDDANIDFINFEGEPTTNRTGTLYIYADEDSYIYEVTSKGAKKINGAYYDDDEEAWVIRTRNLTSYAISDKKLKTVDQMNNGSSSSSGSNSGSNSGSGSNNGKPNPDTGR